MSGYPAQNGTRQAITKQQLESLHIIVPPLDLQEGFASFVTEIDKLKLQIFIFKSAVIDIHTAYECDAI